MIPEQKIRDWECPECGESGMTAREFRNHGVNVHPEKEPMTDLYPKYYVCRATETPVYMLAVAENGPYYMAWDNRDFVDEMHEWDLLRHDWEFIVPEKTPFTEFIDGNLR